MIDLTREEEYELKNGKIKEWSGNGHQPLALNKLIDEGPSLDEYLINKEQP